MSAGASTEPVGAATLVRWLTAHHRARAAIAVAGSLAPNVRDTLPIQTAVGDAYAAESDWTGLEAFLSPQNWHEQDFVRRSVLLRARTASGKITIDPGWHALLDDSSVGSPELLALGDLAQAWNWRAQEEAAYWRVVGHGFPLRQEALIRLWDLYLHSGDTRGLLRVASEQLADRPNDLGFKNNVAFLSLLLDPRASNAQRLARENWSSAPQRHEVAATYGYALFCGGHIEESLAVFQGLKSEDIKRSNVALYYALALQQAGRLAEAAQYAGYANGPGILPEERKLLEKLRAELPPHP